MRKPVIIFYTKSSVPTPEEKTQMLGLQAFCTLIIENAEYANKITPLSVDGVAGAVPSVYSKFPTAAQALQNYYQYLQQAGINVGVAPKKEQSNPFPEQKDTEK